MNSKTQVPHAQDPKSIRDMFGKIAGKYDLANSVLSFGIHHIWKKKLIRESRLRPDARVLDCATGTGDLAFQFEKNLKGTGQVVGTDVCDPMLDEARLKASRQKSNVKFEWADATQLPYPDQGFDISCISFGIRNVQDPAKALSELGRVVKPGGRVLVLEFGQPEASWMRFLFNAYSKWILPKIGGWLSGEPQAYRYLQTSSAAFPCGEDFVQMAKKTGLYRSARCTPLQFGIAYLYVLER